MIIKLPFPAKELMPNQKNGKHWGATHAIKTSQRDTAFYLTMDQTGGRDFFKGSDNIPISLLYLMPDNRHRDCDNMLAASKAMLDGVAQALGIDDKRFKPVLIDWVLGEKNVGGLIVCVGVKIQIGVSFE